jgi:raffinose/stachyose/melibiose transport system substrate-binding protein
MRIVKRLVFLGFLLVLAAGIAFGGGEKQGSGLKIHYITARAETETTVMALKDVAAEYKALHPDFSFEIESIAARASYLQKIRILAASNELPEWFDADPEDFFASLVEAGKVYDIESLYRELGVFDKVYRISRDYLRLPRDQSLYLMGLQANSEYIFYNKDMFRTAGISKPPANFDEFLTACEALQKAGFTPITTSTLEWPSLRYFAMIPFRMTGNRYIMDAVQGKASWGAAPGIAAAEFMQKISKYFQVGFSTASYDTMMDLFLGNQAAMLYIGTWELGNLTDASENIKENIGYFTMPVYSNNDATPPTDFFSHSGIGVAIAKEKMTPQMKDFLKFFFDRYADICVEKYNFIPSIAPSAKAKITPLLNSVLKDIEGVQEYAYCWDVVIDQASLEVLNKSNTELCLGLITPQQWANTMDTIVAENLKK